MTPSHQDSKKTHCLGWPQPCCFVPSSQEYNSREMTHHSSCLLCNEKRHFSFRITCVAMYNNYAYCKSEIYTYFLHTVMFIHAVLSNTSRFFCFTHNISRAEDGSTHIRKASKFWFAFYNESNFYYKVKYKFKSLPTVSRILIFFSFNSRIN